MIAGVLNLLVIYDAFAGPMFREPLKVNDLESASAVAEPNKPATVEAPVAAPVSLPPPEPPQVVSPAPSPETEGGTK